MEQSELDKILKLHRQWLCGSDAGRRADLSGANLSGVDLARTDLSKANLSGANLSGAKLHGAYLYGANFETSYIKEGDTKYFITSNIKLEFQFIRDPAVYFGGYIKIGCHYHSVKYWLANFRKIGNANEYTSTQINAYGRFIKFCKTYAKLESIK